MAENDQDNDEYKFAELDSLGGDEDELNEPTSAKQGQQFDGKNVKRNALIAVGVIILAMVVYKLVGWMHSGKSNNTSQITPTPAAQVVTPPTETTITSTSTPAASAPVVQEQPIVTTTDNNLNQKVSAIEQVQQSVKTEISSVGEQVGVVNNNINNLNTQIANLNQVIGNLTNQLAKQSEEINILMARTQPKPIVHRVRNQIRVPRTIYYIQAVIPGRAWLIGSNGSTLTVREGTNITGYGVVKLIDSMQGRVLTSSGQIIRFSQEDS
jgi:intracellular multiplication protein IcmG